MGSLLGVVEAGYRSEPVVRVMVPPIRGIRGVIGPISSLSIFYTREGSAGDEILDLCLWNFSERFDFAGPLLPNERMEEDFEGKFGSVITFLNTHHGAAVSVAQAYPDQGSTGSLTEIISLKLQSGHLVVACWGTLLLGPVPKGTELEGFRLTLSKLQGQTQVLG